MTGLWWPAPAEAYREAITRPVPPYDGHCDMDCCGDTETCRCDCGFCDCRYAERQGS